MRFGVAVLDAYLEFLAVRSRPNTVVAVAYDLKVFFTVVGKPPRGWSRRMCWRSSPPSTPVARLAGCRSPANVTACQPARCGVGCRVSGLFAFLHARGDVAANPVPRGLPTRRERQRPRQGVPLVRTPRTLPRILDPGAG
ncbi:site-specific integrase [Dactylosporangium darangshiense]|uniref:hypothetical protein n=1 Tax=Dactylosporangium darangshiense TaxID=579108 RepID=UPI00362B90C0